MKMCKVLFFLSLTLLLVVSAMVIACGDDDDDDDNNDDNDNGGETDDDDSGASCTQDELCSQAIAGGVYEGTEEECLTEAAEEEIECGDNYAAAFACACECYANESDCTAWANCSGECWGTYCE